MAVVKRVLDPSRRRSVPADGFSWIDRRFLREGFAAPLAAHELLLYFFLCAVADQDGLSFFGERSVAATLRLDRRALALARAHLESEGLILYRAPLYQVLAVPPSAAAASAAPSCARRDVPGVRALGELLGSAS
jgi:hypothetical protein